MKAKEMAPSLMMAGRSYTNPVRVLFLRVDFKQESPDDTTTTGDGTWNNCTTACNNDPDYWVNKDKTALINYYNEVSYSLLTLDVTISTSVYHLPNIMATYGTNTNEYQAMVNLVRDSIQAADSTIDFSQYDAILVVHAGAGEETDVAPTANGCSAINNEGDSCNDIWSVSIGDFSISTNDNGATITEAIIMPQIGTQDGGTVDPLGIYAHEFGHWLGLPDLYDTKLFPTWDGVGKWSLMGDGIYLAGSDGISGSSPAHPDAWCKTYLGWVTPSEPVPFPNVGDPGKMILAPINELALTPAQANQRMLRLPASTTTPSQYFLLENRQKTGFDSGLPGSGLLVWLIDEAIIGSNDCINFPHANICKNTVNNNPLWPGVKPIEADGNNDLMTYGGDYGGPGDPFPGITGNTSFTPYTNPSSTPYIGSAWLYLTNIYLTTPQDVALTIGFAPPPPANLAATRNSSTVLSWTANTENDLASYKIYRNGSFLADTTQNQYTDTSSTSGDSYSVTAVDSNGYESAKSAIVTITFSTGGGGGGGGCFIATAAYGSYEAPYVRILREFRDRYLLKSFEFRVLSFEFEIPNIAGRTFVKFYYKVSPPIADFIRESEALRAAVRLLLLPLIGFAAFLVKTSLVQQLATLGTFFIIFKSFIVRRLRR